jgi:hypothetical protein
MATEIVRYRGGVAQMADAIAWMRQDAPFATILAIEAPADSREIENDPS